MRRFARPFLLALGLPFAVALVSSCADYATSASRAGMQAASGVGNALVGPQVVISQVYGGGGNAGSVLRNDFIELHNRGTTAVSVAGWSVQYASNTGTFNQATPLTGSIPAGGYYLIQEAAQGGGTQNLPTPNVIAAPAIPMAAGAGKVLLATVSAPLGAAGGTCPAGANVVDFVSYGTGSTNCNGLGTTGTISAVNAAIRNDNGCAYSTAANAMSATFTVATAAPRNSSTPPVTCDDTPQPVVDDVTLDAVNTTLEVGQTRQLTAHAFSNGVEIPAAFTWSATPAGIVSVSGAGLVTAQAPGDAEVRATTSNGEFAAVTMHVDEATLPDLPAVRFSEIHYDNIETDVGEAIEIEGPAGTDLSGWKVVLYNGANGTAYDTRVLTQTIPATCAARGVVVLRYEQDGVQNGSPDGMALVDAGGNVVEFLSYEGVTTATDGPAAGKTSTNIGVQQISAPHFQTLQRRPSGIWEGPKASTLGGCHGSTPVTPVNQLSFSGRSPFDAPLPLTFEDQLFATLRSPSDASVTTTITWLALTPAIATIDADGVVRAVSVGNARFRATAAEGTTNTFTLPMAAATASTTAQYANHTEFGVPVDANPADDEIVERTEFTASFSKARGIPNWVSYNLEATHITPGQDRCDCFTYDPMLPADFTRYTTADYTGAGSAAGFGIDRGHLARSFDRTSGSLDNARTFYFTNIIPQASDNNQGPWADLENHIGAMAQGGTKEVWVIAGAHGSQGTVKGEGVITIPASVWKVALIMPRNQGLADVDSRDDVEVIAIIMPNISFTNGLIDNWQHYRTTVDAVEALTGYDVLSLLPDQVEIAVESNTRPPTASVNGPFTINEGGSVQFSGTAADPDAGQSLTLHWAFGDGSTGAGTAPSHTYAQNGVYTVTFTATDPLGLVATATTTVTVNNVAPSITSLNVPASVVSGSSLTAAGTFSDPGPDAPWSFSFAWGEGSPSTGLVTSPAVVASASHTYFAVGTYTVRFTVTDKDGASAFAERQVQVVRLQVESDVNPNRINLNENGNGRVMVRLLSSASFDATATDAGTARIGAVAPVASSVEDVNGDGRADMVLHFVRRELIESGALSESATQLVLHATLGDGRQIESRPSVRVR